MYIFKLNNGESLEAPTYAFGDGGVAGFDERESEMLFFIPLENLEVVELAAPDK